MCGCMRLLTIAIIALALRASAQDKLAGRWEGVVEIPGRELSVVVDLAKNNAAQWEGSITFPELRIAGAALSEFTVNAADASFAIKSALADQRTGPAKFKGQLKDENHLAGEFVQAGNTAPFRLTRAGPAQVFTPPHSSVISKELEGEWHGEYELFGYPRKVTLKLQNRGADGATADFVRSEERRVGKECRARWS